MLHCVALCVVLCTAVCVAVCVAVWVAVGCTSQILKQHQPLETSQRFTPDVVRAAVRFAVRVELQKSNL